MEGTPAVPLHFLDEMEEPDAPEVNPVEMEEIVDPVDMIDPTRLILPCEKELMKGYVIHFNTFADVVARNINQPISTQDLISMHASYAAHWGQHGH